MLDRGPREIGGIRMDVLTSMSFETTMKDLAAILKIAVSCRYTLVPSP